MHFEVKNLFSFLKKFTRLKNQVEVFNTQSEIINKEKEKLDLFEYEILKEKESEYYISFQDFLFFLENDQYSLRDILSRFKHIGELDKSKFSYLEAYAIPKEDGILLTTTLPEGRKVNKVRIVSCSTK
jgi:hypothetical protein